MAFRGSHRYDFSEAPLDITGLPNLTVSRFGGCEFELREGAGYWVHMCLGNGTPENDFCIG